MSLENINPLPLSVIDNHNFVLPFDVNNKNTLNLTAFANGSYPLTRRLFIIVRQGGVEDGLVVVTLICYFLKKDNKCYSR